VEQYARTALRMALIVGNSPGQDVTFSEEKVKGYKTFQTNCGILHALYYHKAQFPISNFQFPMNFQYNLSNKDKEFLEREKEVKRDVEENMKLSVLAGGGIAYHFVWHEFADKIIEEKKKLLADETISQNEKTSSAVLLNLILLESLKMLHPFMPFVTEAIYQRLPIKEKEFLIVENWEK
jgi:valyl-tRNA synthetase